MKQKFKRYLVIFPLVFTLLLSCFPLLGAHAELLDKSFVDEIDTNYDSILKEPFDFSSLIPDKLDKTFASSICINNLSGSSYTTMKNLRDNSPYYYYSIFADSSLDSVLSHEASYCNVYCFFSVFSDNSLIEDTSSYYHYSSCGFASYGYYRFDGSTLSYRGSYRNESDGNFYYSKDLGIPYRFKSNNVDRFSLEQDYYVIYQETNLPDFEYSDGSGHPDSGKLNVDVRFNPTLSGNVDRKIKADLSNSDLHSWNYDESTVSEDINLYIQNNSKSGVQVMMCIVQPGYRPSLYDRNLYQNTNAFGCDFSGSGMVYLWMSDEWNYFYDSSTEHAVMGGVNVVRTHSKTNWHYVAPGNYSHRFSWRQIDLKFNQSYDVLVYAVKNDYGVASRQFQLSSQNGFIDLSTAQLVYSSNFTCKTPYTFDPTSNAYGNMPSSSYLDYYEAAWSSDAYIDSSTGETIVGKKTSDDYRSVRNDYLGFSDGPYSGSLGFDSTHFSSGSGFTSLGYSISGFLSFFNRVFSFLPGDFISLIGLSITSLVVVSIFKGVFHG